MEINNQRGGTFVDVNDPFSLCWKYDFHVENPMKNLRRSIQQISFEVKFSPCGSKRVIFSSGVVESNENCNLLFENLGSLLNSSSCYKWSVNANLTNPTTQYTLTNSSVFFTTIDQVLFNESEWLSGGYYFRSQEIDLSSFLKSDNKVKHAYLFISGLGYNIPYVNGQRVSTRILDPAWTDYNKTVLYTAYEVSKFIIVKNVVEVEIGNGWFLYENKYGYYVKKTVRLTLEVVFDDGKRFHFHSSPDSFFTGEGPIVEDSTYNGEVYDSRIPRGENLRTAELFRGPPGRMKLQTREPVTDDEQFGPVYTREMGKRNVFVVDFGQNFAGVCIFTLLLRGQNDFGLKAGDNVTLRHGEVAYGNGYVDQRNLRSAKATDVYIFNGNETESVTYRPRFTYHMIRFVQIEIYSDVNFAASDFTVVGVHFHNELKRHGDFHTDLPLLNRLYKAIMYTETSNKMGIPTHCSNRDERTPWLADLHLSSKEAMYSFDLSRLYISFMDDIVDGIDAGDKSLPDVVPFFPRSSGAQKHADPSWSAAYPILTHNIFKHYGVKNELLQRHYVHLKEYVMYLDTLVRDVSLGKFYCKFGDWAVPYPNSFGHICQICASVHLLMNLDEMSEFASILGFSGDVGKFREMYRFYLQKFYNAFVTFNETTKEISDMSQTALVLGLFVDNMGKYLSKQETDYFVDVLVKDIIVKSNYHLTTGIFGTKYLFPVLTNLGYHDLALAILERISYPGYGYMLTNSIEPATTLWEIFNATNGDLFLHLPLASRSHVMFGSVGQWLFEYVAGLRNSEGSYGFDNFEIHPYVQPNMQPNVVRVKTEATRGRIKSEMIVRDSHFCRIVDEHDIFSVKCPGGGKITGISFSSYGLPSGRCIHGFKRGAVHSKRSKYVLENLCLGNSTCEFVVTENLFADDSQDDLLPTNASKQLIVEGDCSPVVKEIELNVEVPINSDAEVSLPIYPIDFFVKEDGDKILVSDLFGRVFHAKRGITDGWVKNNRVYFSVGSGVYSFVMTAKPDYSLSFVIIVIFVVVVVVVLFVSFVFFALFFFTKKKKEGEAKEKKKKEEYSQIN